MKIFTCAYVYFPLGSYQVDKFSFPDLSCNYHMTLVEKKKQATLVLAHSFAFSYGYQIKGITELMSYFKVQYDTVTVLWSMFGVRPGEGLPDR